MMKKSQQTTPKWLRVVVPSILLIVWLALAGLGGPYFGRISEVASNDQSTFLPSSAESTRVNAELEKFQNEDSIPAIIVFTNNDTQLPEETVTRIGDETAKLADMPDVIGNISPPIKSEDGKAALVVVNAKSEVDYKEFIPELHERIESSKLPVEFKITGPVGFLNDLAAAFSGIDGLLLGVALTVVFLILLIVYRSPVLPIIVLINSIFALSAAILLVFYLAKAGVIALNGQVQGILFILVIGAATDYALLYIARYREELTRHQEPYQAIMASWKRSLEPILAAGGTVTAGLLCLLLSDLTSNKALGPVGAIGIILAIISTLTLLPSLLLMWGRKVFWPRMPQYQNTAKLEVPLTGIWRVVANFVKKRSRSIWILTTIVLAISTVGLVNLRADGIPQSDFILGSSEARDGQILIDKHFPGGSGTPTQIILHEASLTAALKKIESDKGVDTVSIRANNSDSGSMPLGRAKTDIEKEIRIEADKELTSQKADLRTQIEAQTAGAPNFIIDQIYNEAVSNIPTTDEIVADAYPFKDATPKVVNNEILLEVTLKDNADSDEAQTTVTRLRETVHQIDPSSRIGGATAVQLDTRESSKHDRAVVIPAVLIVITLILMILLRSLLAPFLLLLTTVISFAATLGIASILFNNVWHFPGADPSVVLYGFIFLVALGIDYNIFLMTRVREESLRIGTKKGVLAGLVVTGGVITSAGIVLAATFAALAVLPILFLVQLAFIVAFGVLLDTIIVRSLLVPALVYDIGNNVWWPSSRKYKK